MHNTHVKRAQKAALFLKEISILFLQASIDHKDLKDLYPSRVSFSSDTGICTIFFFSPHGRTYFNEKLPFLKLFKPSLRAAIAKRIPQRRVPDFIFKYDDDMEKQQRFDSLLDKLRSEGKL